MGAKLEGMIGIGILCRMLEIMGRERQDLGNCGSDSV